ncbi:hypothetical protein [Streptomyces sp. CBMA123]|uniref:hypothetical protein n=1 Tax=Streptomyces sp. CBMA123 TaxID=1896313 RepID=UPI001661B8CD|nr:hypothetical protein [Streptomyces sp. CBMA123]MBD0693484.1 hypothetical protein [Streptomyces sp. CBMA123]
MTAAHRRRLTAVFAAAGITLGAAACSSSAGGVPGPGALSYDTVRSTAEKLQTDKQDTCPFDLDLAKALKAAGIPGGITPDHEGGHAVQGSVGDGLPPQPWPSGASHPASMPSVPATPPHADIICAYRAGTTGLNIELFAVPQPGTAVNMLLPGIQRAAQLSVAGLQQFATEQPGPGQTRLVGKGTAALARIAPKGEGDIVLMLSQDTGSGEPDRGLTGEPLRKAAENLVGQLR